jgi:hypothetical protein
MMNRHISKCVSGRTLGSEHSDELTPGKARERGERREKGEGESKRAKEIAHESSRKYKRVPPTLKNADNPSVRIISLTQCRMLI